MVQINSLIKRGMTRKIKSVNFFINGSYLCVAGGGGGGTVRVGINNSGGGGGGGFLAGNFSSRSGVLIEIVVGAGGPPQTQGSNSRLISPQTQANLSVISYGGGGGDSGSGGSGAGGLGSGSPTSSWAGGAGVYPGSTYINSPIRQGYNGGTGWGSGQGGGGGGAGGNGGNGVANTSSGGGGAGASNNFSTGVNSFYAGGGAAGWDIAAARGGGTGGSGGGGNQGQPGGTNTGGGAGGGSVGYTSPGTGGSGIVVLRLPVAYSISYEASLTASQTLVDATYRSWTFTQGQGNIQLRGA